MTQLLLALYLINITHVCLKDFATFTDNTKYIKKEASGCKRNKTFYFLNHTPCFCCPIFVARCCSCSRDNINGFHGFMCWQPPYLCLEVFYLLIHQVLQLSSVGLLIDPFPWGDSQLPLSFFLKFPWPVHPLTARLPLWGFPSRLEPVKFVLQQIHINEVRRTLFSKILR